MAAITVTAKKVSPLPGAIVREFDFGGDVNVGDVVYIASDGDTEQANGGVAGTAYGRGIVVSVGTQGTESGGAGDRASVVTEGPVAGFTGMIPGDPHYVSDTAGKLDTAAGTVSHIMGYAESAEIFHVQPAAA